MFLRDQRVAAAIAAAVIVCLATSCSVPGSDAGKTAPSSEALWGNATTVEELRIGVEFGEDEYMFGTIRGMAVGADGTICIADRQPVVVRVYDSEGTFVRNIGGEGQGPGEFTYPPLLGMLPDGRLVARDQSRRVSLFSAEGEFLDSFPVAGFTGLIVGRDNTVHVHQSEGDVVLVGYSLDGEELGRLEFPPRDMAGAQTFVLGFGEGDIYPFPTETQSAWSPFGYLVTGRNDVYDIEVRDPEGTIHLRRNVEPAEVNGEEQAEWEAFRQSLILRTRARGDVPDFEPIPDVKPYFRRIYVGENGRIWVFRYVAARKRDDIEPVPERPDRPLLTWREPWTFDVFGPDGTFLGSVEVPETFRPFVFRGDRIWGALTDEDGIERVLRLAVVPEAG